jgi:hypothetical protein
MRKGILLLAFLIGSIETGHTQHIFYDAFKLRALIDTATRKFKTDSASLNKVTAILQNYIILPAGSPRQDYSSVNALLTTPGQTNYNPFLLSYLPDPGHEERSSVSPAASLLKSAGDINVTGFAEGLAKFLLERSREELNVAFFRKFKDFLKQYPEVKVLFPASSRIIGNIDSYSYAAMLPALRVSFLRDMDVLASNILNLRDIANYSLEDADTLTRRRIREIVKLSGTPGGRSAAAAILVADGILKESNPAEIISRIREDKLCADYNDNFSHIIRFTELLSRSLRSNEGRVWVTGEQVSMLVKDHTAFRLFLGLIYATNKQSRYSIVFSWKEKKLSLEDFLKELQAGWSTESAEKFRKQFEGTAKAMSEASDNAVKLSGIRKPEDSLRLLYAEYTASVAKALKECAGFLSSQSLNPQLLALEADVKRFTALLDDAADVSYDIKTRNYGALVLHSHSLISGLLGPQFIFSHEYLKYGTFMANIAVAENSNEVRSAIEAAVLPAGSSSVKRETDFNVSLNAFIGPFAGGEYLPALKQDRWAFSAGFTAPVGIAFSFGNFGNGKRCTPPVVKTVKNKEVGGKSLSFFVPLIDIGTVASFRFGNDSTEVASEITLANIISPGLYLYYGFGRSPVSLGVGAQLGPQLRTISASGINIDRNYYFRYGLSIVVDIPLFNLYTKN